MARQGGAIGGPVDAGWSTPMGRSSATTEPCQRRFVAAAAACVLHSWRRWI